MDGDRLDQAIADREIRRTLAQYCQYLDDGHFDQWIELFTEDTEFVVMGMHKRGRAEVLGFIEPSQQADARGTHTISEPLITVEGDTASATTDFVWFSRSREVGQIGRYHDTLVRSGQRWRFATREIVFAGGVPVGQPSTGQEP